MQRERTPQLRTLESLQEDFDRFTAAGADHTKAKLYNNVISTPFFDVPLDQVRNFDISCSAMLTEIVN